MAGPVMVWTLTIDGDDTVTTTVHPSDQAAIEGLRAYFDGDDVPTDDDDLLEWATTRGGVCVWIDSHSVDLT